MNNQAFKDKLPAEHPHNVQGEYLSIPKFLPDGAEPTKNKKTVTIVTIIIADADSLRYVERVSQMESYANSSTLKRDAW